MSAKQKILIVSGDAYLSGFLLAHLGKEGYDAKSVNDGRALLQEAAVFRPDLVLLETSLPVGDGYQACSELRSRSFSCAVILLSADTDISDRVRGLDLGADDFLLKPFDLRELTARIRAVLRRCQPQQAEQPKIPGKYVQYPDLLINLTNYSVIYRGETVDMPPKELELLYFLASSPNQVFTREQLLDHIWGYEYIGDARTVDVHIKRIREKIKDHEKWAITTVWGIGYKFERK